MSTNEMATNLYPQIIKIMLLRNSKAKTKNLVSNVRKVWYQNVNWILKHNLFNFTINTESAMRKVFILIAKLFLTKFSHFYLINLWWNNLEFKEISSRDWNYGGSSAINKYCNIW